MQWLRGSSRNARVIGRALILAFACGLYACDQTTLKHPSAPRRLDAAVNAAGDAFPVEVVVAPHPDDWQLFYGDRVQSSAQTAQKVVFIYTTAGDAGTAVSMPAYWQARQSSADASVDSLTAGGAKVCGNQTVGGHVIMRCTNSNSVSYYLRLPDGNGEGQGYGGRGSLVQLRTGVINSINAIDGTTTYTSWNDLVATVQGIIGFEAAGMSESLVALHTNDWDLANNSGDHPDHLNTGELTKSALVGHGWTVFWYVGYPTMNSPINLSQTEFNKKFRLIKAYDDVMKNLMGETIIGTSHTEDWAWRTIYRTQAPEGPPPPPPPPAPPAAPTALQASAVDATHIDLNWSDNSSNEDGFRIEQAPDVAGVAGTYTEIATVSASVKTFSVSGLSATTRYWYRVRAYNSLGTSDYTNESDATTPAMPSPPGAPTALQATAGSITRIDLSWTDNASSEQGFRIERAPDVGGSAGTYAEIGTVTPNVTTYSATGLINGTKYWFRVRSYNAQGNSAYSNEATATTPAPPPNSFPVEFFVQAHPDDWQLFLGNRVQSSAGTASKIVFVYTTAGDAGTAVSNPPYWQARQTAADASVDSLVGGPAKTCSTQNIAGHAIMRCAKSNAVSYYMRLPDGNGEGQGYSGRGSLMQLRTGVISTIRAVDNTATYTSWSDLVSTLQGIVTLESGGQSDVNIAFHVNDYNATLNSGDHSDHMNTGNLVDDAAVGHAYNYFWYIGYPSMNSPINLSQGEFNAKMRVIIAYDDVMKRLMGETIIGTSHTEDWAWRTIYRSQPSNGVPEPPPPPPSAPNAPSGLNGSATSGTSITISWTDNAGDEQGFRVERAPDNAGTAGTYTQIASVGANVGTYTNSGLTAGTRYWYRVRAYNAVGNSSYSNATSIVTQALPNAPSGLTATATSTSRISLAWTDNATDEQGFRVERAPDNAGSPGTFAQIASVGAGVTTYNNTGLTVGTKYWYRVRAYNAVGTSAYTNNATTSTFALPAVPTNVQATPASSVAMDVTWTDNATDETSLRLERATDVGGAPGTFGSAVTLGAGVTSYRVTGLQANTKYWWRVRAQNSNGNSAFSTPGTGTTLAYVAPSGLSATSYLVGTTRNVDLRWTRGSELTVDVFRNGSRIASAVTNNGGPWNNQPATSLGNSVTYQVCAAGKTGTANCSLVVTANF